MWEPVNATAGSWTVSARLVQVLRTYCRGVDGRGLHDLHNSMAAGRYPWLRAELHAALAQDAFTPGEWAQYIGSASGAEPGPQAMRDQQHRVWAVLFPGHAYPERSPAGP